MISEDNKSDYINSLMERICIAQKIYEEFTQTQVDKIIAAMAKAADLKAEELARMAVEETGFGRIEDKIVKNRFASRDIFEYIKDMKTVGIISSYPDLRIAEVVSPVGVILAIIPSTNPTSTTIYKALISLKSRNGVVFSPHPAATKCIKYTTEILHKAAVSAGAPEGIIGCFDNPTMEATGELMRHSKIAVILATGGMGLVRAAYSSGKPAYGVGPGNVPAYIDRSANVDEAVRCILTGKSFDWGTVCSSEQAIIADAPVFEQVIAALKKFKAYICSREETAALEKTVVTPQISVNPEIVGKSPVFIASKAGLKVPEDTTALVVPYEGVGKNYPLSIEKLSPVLALYKVKDWREGCERCIRILNFGGLGHTLSMHCHDEEIIKEFALKKPASRILVNTSSTHGAIGYTTSLPPSLTLGCGPLGGNITSDNITPLHLLTIKRLAYAVQDTESTLLALQKRKAFASAIQSPAGSPDFVERNIDRDSVKMKVEEIVGSYLEGKTSIGGRLEKIQVESLPATTADQPPVYQPESDKIKGQKSDDEPVSDFVCENDVQKAVNSNRKILIDRKTIITPLARELGEKYGVFQIK